MVRRQLVHGSLVVLVGILVLLCSQSGEGFRQRRTVFQPTAKHSFANGIHRANRGSTHFFQRHMLRSSDVPSSSSRGSSRSGTVLKSTTINTEFHYDGPDQYVAFQLSSKSFVPMPKEEDKIDHLRNQLDIDEIDGTGLVDEVTFDELRSRWLDICIDENCPDDFDNIRYDVLLPQLMSTGRHLRIVDKSDSKISMESVSATFITEFELNRLWRRHSLMGFSNLQEEFHIKNALLLVDDEMDEQLLQMGVDAKLLLAQQEQQQQMADYVQPSTEASATTKTETEPKVSTKGKGNKKSTDVDLMSVNAMPLPFEEDLEDDEELILTEHVRVFAWLILL